MADWLIGRRRKIKCITRDERPSICNECFARGIPCIDQESAAETQTAETRQSLRERVAQLESVVKTIVLKIDNEDSGSGSESSGKAKCAPVTSDLGAVGSGIEHAPIMSLFNNDFLTGQADTEPADPPPEAPRSRDHEKSREDKIRQKLMSVLPSNRDVDTIFEGSPSWCRVWQRMFPESAEPLVNYTKKVIASGPLLSMCKGLLCLALSLQQLPASFIKQRLNLPRPAQDIVFHYMSTIEKNVLANDHYCTNIEALECMILMVKLDSNAGRPRKSWLTFRRAISFALLMGFHRKSRWQSTPSDPSSGPRRRAVFFALFQGDRYFSLFLGLPYSLSDQQCDIGSITNDQNLTDLGMSPERIIRLSNLGGRLIDRCQNPELVSLSSTMKYDQELEELSKSLPPLVDLNEPGQNFEDFHDRTLARFHHHHIRSLLHLPFMLKAGTDRRYEYNRIAALESAREMILAYKVLRIGSDNGYCLCKTMDFLVFTVCVMLLLNAYGLAALPDQSQDLKLVADVKNLFNAAITESGNPRDTVQDQAVRTLSMMLDCESSEKQCEGKNQDCKVVIPYFGTITVRPGKDFALFEQNSQNLRREAAVRSASICSNPTTQQWQQLPTPPQGPSSISSGSNTASPDANTSISFDPFNLPMPSGFGNLDVSSAGSDQTFFDQQIQSFPDWTGGYDISNGLPCGDVDFELDNNWSWFWNDNNQQQARTG